MPYYKIKETNCSYCGGKGYSSWDKSLFDGGPKDIESGECSNCNGSGKVEVHIQVSWSDNWDYSDGEEEG